MTQHPPSAGPPIDLMRRAGYPELETHRRHHAALIDELSARQAAMLMHMSGADAEELIRFLVHGFLGHTTGEDRRFADFLLGGG